MQMPKVSLTLDQIAELVHRLPHMPQEFSDKLRPYSTCKHTLDYITSSSVYNLMAEYRVGGDGDLEVTLTMHGGQHMWTVTIPR